MCLDYPIHWFTRQYCVWRNLAVVSQKHKCFTTADASYRQNTTCLLNPTRGKEIKTCFFLQIPCIERSKHVVFSKFNYSGGPNTLSFSNTTRREAKKHMCFSNSMCRQVKTQCLFQNRCVGRSKHIVFFEFNVSAGLNTLCFSKFNASGGLKCIVFFKFNASDCLNTLCFWDSTRRIV